MKKLLYSVLLMLLFACTAKVVNFDQLQNRNGLYFLVNSEKPFSGEVVSYVNGKLEFDGDVKNGLMEGEWNYYYPSGQKKMAGLYTDGLKEGTWTYWKENGSQDAVEIYKLGKKLGNDTTSTETKTGADTLTKSQPAQARTDKPVVKTTLTQQQPLKEESKKPQSVVWERLRGAAVKYLDGIPYNGMVIKYYREGGKELDGEFVNGHRHGKWVFYDRYGNIKDVRYY